MKVLQINAVYGQGSTGTIVRDIENLCEQSGIECYVASPDKRVIEAKSGYVIGNVIDHKLHALLSRFHGKQAYFSHIPTMTLLRWMDKIKPDIVHLHNLHSNYIHLNMLLKYLAKKDIKTIITLHDCWFYTGGCFHYTVAGCDNWLTNCENCPKQKQDTPSFFNKHSAQVLVDRKKYLLAIPHLYITGVAEWMAHESLKSFLKGITNYVIHNGIDMSVFKPTSSDFRNHLGLEKKTIILGPASKWLLPVNKDVLIKFFKYMQPDEVLLLFGVWSDRQNDYINSLHLPNGKVQTYGYTKNREELAALYTMADVFVNTTREDSLSLINVEAQACGTPVVTFDQTGPRETVDNVNSFNVPVGNAGQLYEMVRKVCRNKDKEISQKCRWFVENKFNMYDKYQLYIELYKKIITE